MPGAAYPGEIGIPKLKLRVNTGYMCKTHPVPCCHHEIQVLLRSSKPEPQYQGLGVRASSFGFGPSAPNAQTLNSGLCRQPSCERSVAAVPHGPGFLGLGLAGLKGVLGAQDSQPGRMFGRLACMERTRLRTELGWESSAGSSFLPTGIATSQINAAAAVP